MDEKNQDLSTKISAWLNEHYSEIETYYNASGIQLPFRDFLIVVFISAAFIAIVSIYLSEVFPVAGDSPYVLGAVAFLAVLSLGAVIPLNMRDSRVKRVEDSLPNALKHISVILRAGGTIESAVDEVSKSNYGPLSDDLARSLIQLQRGRTFEEVLDRTARNSGSKLFMRCTRIIIDAKRSGAGLADSMNAIADDAREINRLKRERVSRTMMHVIFIYASTLAIAPVIFGFSLVIVSFIGNGIVCAVPGAPPLSLGLLDNILLVFLAIEALVATLAVGVIQEGRFMRNIVKAPVMILIAIAVFEVGKRIGTLIIGGGGSC
jgi:archaellum biogenesis protein FlaJ (TadC family)